MNKIIRIYGKCIGLLAGIFVVVVLLGVLSVMKVSPTKDQVEKDELPMDWN